jgi:hypothetical protein
MLIIQYENNLHLCSKLVKKNNTFLNEMGQIKGDKPQCRNSKLGQIKWDYFLCKKTKIKLTWI